MTTDKIYPGHSPGSLYFFPRGEGPYSTEWLVIEDSLMFPSTRENTARRVVMNAMNLRMERSGFWNPFRMFSARPQSGPAATGACSLGAFAGLAVAGKTVLIVDDDAVVRTGLSNALRRAGHKVRTAVDCAEAIAVVGETAPDLIVVDLSFPPDIAQGGLTHWDGFQLIMWLRGLSNAERAKFIVITGSDTAEVRKRARRFGAIAFLGKPVDAAELIKLVESGGEKFPLRRQ